MHSSYAMGGLDGMEWKGRARREHFGGGYSHGQTPETRPRQLIYPSFSHLSLTSPQVPKRAHHQKKETNEGGRTCLLQIVMLEQLPRKKKKERKKKKAK